MRYLVFPILILALWPVLVAAGACSSRQRPSEDCPTLKVCDARIRAWEDRPGPSTPAEQAELGALVVECRAAVRRDCYPETR